jgi:hypothetical protein
MPLTGQATTPRTGGSPSNPPAHACPAPLFSAGFCGSHPKGAAPVQVIDRCDRRAAPGGIAAGQGRPSRKAKALGAGKPDRFRRIGPGRGTGRAAVPPSASYLSPPVLLTRADPNSCRTVRKPQDCSSTLPAARAAAWPKPRRRLGGGEHWHGRRFLVRQRHDDRPRATSTRRRSTARSSPTPATQPPAKSTSYYGPPVDERSQYGRIPGSTPEWLTCAPPAIPDIQ